ncbi:ribosomal protein s14 [Diplodia corticola]|uniref:Ribosomal protein s14 n=1 Tax=Diplodia corticola TaxID=236234 RepID=A0A1J9RXG8_9PEZI|nr:ribosomal protein s14 [Diplodia corticola]OJD37339.1 ribosomal protein s14 [Diplodia corticola]
MFKLSQAGIPEDPSYPRNLSQLGYFIDKQSEIRTIRPPHNYYNFWISNNDRVNEAFRESMHACINEEIIHRMTALGIPPIYLPHLATEKPHGQANVPILVTEKEELRKLKKVTVVVNDDFQDLGLWAYRIVSKERGLEAGSVVSLAKALHNSDIASVKVRAHCAEKDESGPDESPISNPGPHDSGLEPGEVPTHPAQETAENEKHDLKESLISKPGANIGPESPIASKTPVTSTEDVPFKVPENWQAPGLVVLNPGQLLYSYRLDKAVTKQSWDSQPRPSAIHPVPRIDPVQNRAEGHRTVDEHVKSTFDTILNSSDWVAPDAKIYMIGIGNGGDAILKTLSKEWPKYQGRVEAIALTDPTPVHEVFEDQGFVRFLRDRGRALVPSAEALGVPLAVPPPGSSDLPQHSSDWGYHYYPIQSSGERVFGEIIFPTNQRDILDWFDGVANTADYRNPQMQVPEFLPEGLEDAEIFDATKDAPEEKANE